MHVAIGNMHLVQETLHEFRIMNKRRFAHQAVNLFLIVSTALMTWKGLMLATMSESPVVVVLSGSMEPCYYRGDILLLELREDYPLEVGDVIVYKLSSKEIPIVHRIVSIHETPDQDPLYLTKGDNNNVNDRALYSKGQLWVERKDLMGRARMYMPYVGIITIWLSDYPILKYLLIGSMVLVVLTSREPQS